MTARRATTWPRLLAGFLVIYGVLAIGTALDAGAHFGLLTLAGVVVAAVLTERIMTRSGGGMLQALGLGRPGVPALVAGAAVALLVLSVYPLTTAITGSSVAFLPDWLWLLLGVFAVHGLAEELVWRGFVFRRLRQGCSFWPAVWRSMPFIVAAHVPIVLTAGPVVGSGAMLVAAVTSVPLSYLYEWGRRTIWAPALVHSAIDSFKIVDVEASSTTVFSLSLIAVSVVAPLMIFALPRGLRPALDSASTSLGRVPAEPPRRIDREPLPHSAAPAAVLPITDRRHYQQREESTP